MNVFKAVLQALAVRHQVNYLRFHSGEAACCDPLCLSSSNRGLRLSWKSQNRDCSCSWGLAGPAVYVLCLCVCCSFHISTLERLSAPLRTSSYYKMQNVTPVSLLERRITRSKKVLEQVLKLSASCTFVVARAVWLLTPVKFNEARVVLFTWKVKLARMLLFWIRTCYTSLVTCGVFFPDVVTAPS